MTTQRYRGHTIEVALSVREQVTHYQTSVRTILPLLLRHRAGSSSGYGYADGCCALDAAFSEARAWIDEHPLPWPQIRREACLR